MKKIDLTLVCCYNNKKQLNKELVSSLDKQNVKCDRLFIDNTKNRFSSAAKALNYGASKVKTKYVAFIHQDVVFLNEKSLEEFYNYIKEYDESIIGVAGVKLDKDGIITNIVHGKNKEPAGDITIKKPEKAIALDECLVGMRLSTYEKLKFDEITCDSWHLYVVDMCYSANLDNINTYIVPAHIWHTSVGNLNHSFFIGVDKLRKKYKNKYSVIKSTCITFKTNENIKFKEFKVTKFSKTKIYKLLKRKNS